MKNPCKLYQRCVILQERKGPPQNRWYTTERYSDVIAQGYIKIAVVYSEKKARMMCRLANSAWRTAL